MASDAWVAWLLCGLAAAAIAGQTIRYGARGWPWFLAVGLLTIGGPISLFLLAFVGDDDD